MFGCFFSCSYGKQTSNINGSEATIEGYWKAGKPHGFAKSKLANGDTYAGFYRGEPYFVSADYLSEPPAWNGFSPEHRCARTRCVS